MGNQMRPTKNLYDEPFGHKFTFSDFCENQKPLWGRAGHDPGYLKNVHEQMQTHIEAVVDENWALSYCYDQIDND